MTRSQCWQWRHALARFILINRYFHPDDAATSQIATSLSLALAERGRAVHVVTSRQLYSDAGASLAKIEWFRGMRIHRVWTTRMGRERLLGRSFDYISFYMSAFLWLLVRARRGDTIIALTDPPLISVPSAVAAIMRRCVHISWLHDLFPEVAGALGILPSGICLRMLRRLRNWSLRHSAANVVIGERMARRLVEEGVSVDRIAVIHNWSDASEIVPVATAHNALRSKWGLCDKFVVGYSGNLGRAHDYRTILEAAGLLREDNDVRFLFIGGGHLVAALRAEAQRLGLTNIIVQPYQPRERLSESLSAPDLHLVTLLPALEGLIVPSKFYSIAAAARPIIFIGDQSGEIPRLLDDANCGAAVEIGEGLCLARHIARLKQDTPLRLLWGENGRRLLDQRFDKRHAVGQWINLLDRLAASASTGAANKIGSGAMAATAEVTEKG